MTFTPVELVFLCIGVAIAGVFLFLLAATIYLLALPMPKKVQQQMRAKINAEPPRGDWRNAEPLALDDVPLQGMDAAGLANMQQPWRGSWDDAAQAQPSRGFYIHNGKPWRTTTSTGPK